MIELLISIPIFMPPTVMGYYLLVMLGKYGIIGGIFSKYFGINIIFTQFSAVIASGLASLPILYKTVKVFLNPTLNNKCCKSRRSRIDFKFSSL